MQQILFPNQIFRKLVRELNGENGLWGGGGCEFSTKMPRTMSNLPDFPRCPFLYLRTSMFLYLIYGRHGKKFLKLSKLSSLTSIGILNMLVLNLDPQYLYIVQIFRILNTVLNYTNLIKIISVIEDMMEGEKMSAYRTIASAFQSQVRPHFFLT